MKKDDVLLLIKIMPIADLIKLIIFANEEFFRFFAAKLGHFIINYLFLICNKHSSSSAKIGKLRKKSFIGSDLMVLLLLLHSKN